MHEWTSTAAAAERLCERWNNRPAGALVSQDEIDTEKVAREYLALRPLIDEAIEAFYQHWTIERQGLSPFIRSTGRHGGSPWAELVDALQSLAAYENNLCPGDIALPIFHSQLHCGSGIYARAIVVSVDPFVLVSESSDMRWSATVHPGHFRNGGKAAPEVVERCMRRLEA
jgi:hypothetical protein